MKPLYKTTRLYEIPYYATAILFSTYGIVGYDENRLLGIVLIVLSVSMISLGLIFLGSILVNDSFLHCQQFRRKYQVPYDQIKTIIPLPVWGWLLRFRNNNVGLCFFSADRQLINFLDKKVKYK